MVTSIGLALIVHWRPDADVPADTRRAVDTLVDAVAPVLNEVEAALFDLTERLPREAAFLMPRVALSVPVYETGHAFTLHVSRVEGTRMWVTRRGDARELADVTLR